MSRRLRVSVILVTGLAFVPARAALIEQPGALRGLDTLYVYVVPLDKKVDNCGVSEAALQAGAMASLQASPLEHAVGEAHPTLVISADILPAPSLGSCIYHIGIAVQETVVIRHDQVVATVYEDGAIGLCPTSRTSRVLVEKVKEQVRSLLEAWARDN
jgi:hypothetical protein